MWCDKCWNAAGSSMECIECHIERDRKKNCIDFEADKLILELRDNVDTDEWVSLEKGDNWGCPFYTFKGQRLTGPYNTNNTGAALTLRKGRRIRVRFEDGTIQECALDTAWQQSGYSDHGRDHHFSVELWGVSVRHHGVTVWIPIEKVEVLKKDFA